MKIVESSYDDYILYNGKLSANLPSALELKDNNASYYIVYKDDSFFTDFFIYDNGLITLDENYFKNKELINLILDKFDSITRYFIDDKFIIDNYNVVDIEKNLANRMNFYKITIKK